jgi:hypothetical protein
VTTGVLCESQIESVTVYARGAAVRRRAALPELPDEACDVILGGVTALADPGSLRASLDGAREVLGVRAQLVVPDRPAADESLAGKVEALRRQSDDLVAERNHAVWRRDLLASVSPEPDLVRRVLAIDPADRVADALAIVGLVGDEMAAIDAKIAEVTAAIARNERELAAAMVAASQASAARGKADAPPELRVIIHLGPKRGDAVPGSIEIEYAVAAARWWPAYRARFTDGATRASIALSALVAQASGEDWSGVRLLLSTGDMLRDVRLPELTSLRLGRAQKPRARGYRAPPEGLDAMFDGYDRFVAQVSITTTTTVTASSTVTMTASGSATAAGTVQPWSDMGVAHADEYQQDDEPTAVAAMRDLAAKVKSDKARLGKAATGGAPPPAAPGFGGGMEQQAPRRPAPAAPAQPMMEAEAAKGGLFRGRAKAEPEALFSLSELVTRDADTLGGIEPSALPIEPADAWLDFDMLRLDPRAQRGRRGRLSREASPSAAAAFNAAQAIERLEAPAGTTDPRASRGLFDAVYSAAGTADVPSTGRPHRVTIVTADAPSTPRFVTVPREAPEVYRRADVANPFGVPLLTGPVEVLIDGALVALTRLSYTDRGGMLSIGLGVEERVRVARNTRTDEGTAGLLGGSTTVDHTVTTELASSLGRKITVEVLDRIPVSDEKDVEIKMLASQPQPVAYTQADLGQPVRRGQRWEIEVPAGGKAKIEHRYRITLPSKMEIVGGNRRE